MSLLCSFGSTSAKAYRHWVSCVLSMFEDVHKVWLLSSDDFLLLFSQFELRHLLAYLLPKHIHTGYLVNATPPTILPGYFLNFAGVLCRSKDVSCYLDVT